MTAAARIAMVDFEASAFRGYPVEVGIAIYEPARPDLSMWSALTRPTQAWVETIPLKEISQSIHAISWADLADAESASVADTLNRQLAPVGIICDGGPHDEQRCALLRQEAPESPAFVLKDVSALGRQLGFPPSAIFQLGACLRNRGFRWQFGGESDSAC